MTLSSSLCVVVATVLAILRFRFAVGEGCFLAGGTPVAGARGPAPCELPFVFVDKQNRRKIFEQPASVANASPFGFPRSLKSENLYWCPPKGIQVYDIRKRRSRREWGLARCDHDLRCRAIDEKECVIPFQMRINSRWKWFDYAPALWEAAPFGVEKDVDFDNRRWCSTVERYDPGSQNLQRKWEFVECERKKCKITADGGGWINSETECELPFTFVFENGTARAFEAAPLMSEAPPAGMDILRIRDLDKTRWCPRLGIRVYNLKAETDSHLLQEWGVASCGNEASNPSAALTRSCPCTIDAAKGGFVQDGYMCNIPFVFRFGDGKSAKLFDYPPSLAEALPYNVRDALLPTGMKAEELRWCPPKGVFVYDAQDTRVRKRWGPVQCGEDAFPCKIQSGSQGWISHNDECQLPFEFFNPESGKITKVLSPPSLSELQPFGTTELGLMEKDRALRWCPQLGIRLYDPRDEEMNRKWGIATCAPSVVLSSLAPSQTPSEAPTPTPYPCKIGPASNGFLKSGKCQIPFTFQKNRRKSQQYDFPPKIKDARPFGSSGLGVDQDARWCPPLGIETYNPKDLKTRESWGIVSCNFTCDINESSRGFVKICTQCQLPFEYRDPVSRDWIEFNYAPTLIEAQPFRANRIPSEEWALSRWCPTLGLRKYDPRDSKVRRGWGEASCDSRASLPIVSPTPTPSNCSVDGGYAFYSSKCALPFSFQGELFDECISFSRAIPFIGDNQKATEPRNNFSLAEGHRLWCATEVEYDVERPVTRKRWGYCNPRTCGICSSKQGHPCVLLSAGNQEVLSGPMTPVSPYCTLTGNISMGAVCFVAQGKVEECDLDACKLAPTIQPTPMPSRNPTIEPTLHPACFTTGGGYTDLDTACQFPFQYKGKWFSECLDVNEFEPFFGSVNQPNEPIGTHWCATTERYNPSITSLRKKWGFCGKGCPGIPRTASPTKTPTGISLEFVLGAKYGESGLRIEVTLGTPALTAKSSRWFPCADLIENSRASLCKWKRGFTNLLVEASLRRRITSLSFKEGAFQKVPVVSSAQIVPVQLAADVALTLPILRAPRFYLPGCFHESNTNDFVLLDGSETSNSLLLEEIQFLVRAKSGASQSIQGCTFMSAESTSPPEALFCKFDPIQFEVEASVEVALRVVSFLGRDQQTDWVKIHIIERGAHPFSLNFPAGPTKVLYGSPTFLKVASETCTDNTPIVRKPAAIFWNAFEVGETTIPASPILAKTSDKEIIIMQPWNLGGPNLVSGALINVTTGVSLSENGQISRSFALFEVIRSPTVARVVGGNRSVAIGTQVSLDGGESFDPDGLRHESPPLIYEWQCKPREFCATFGVAFLSTDGNTRPGTWEEVSQLNPNFDEESTLFAVSNFPVLSLDTTYSWAGVIELLLSVKSKDGRYSTAERPNFVRTFHKSNATVTVNPQILQWTRSMTEGIETQVRAACEQDTPLWKLLVAGFSQSFVLQGTDAFQRYSLVSEPQMDLVLDTDAILHDFLDEDFDGIQVFVQCGSLQFDMVPESYVFIPFNRSPSNGVVQVRQLEDYGHSFELTTSGWVDSDGDLPLSYFFEYNLLGSDSIPPDLWIPGRLQASTRRSFTIAELGGSLVRFRGVAIDSHGGQGRSEISEVFSLRQGTGPKFQNDMQLAKRSLKPIEVLSIDAWENEQDTSRDSLTGLLAVASLIHDTEDPLKRCLLQTDFAGRFEDILRSFVLDNNEPVLSVLESLTILQSFLSKQDGLVCSQAQIQIFSLIEIITVKLLAASGAAQASSSLRNTMLQMVGWSLDSAFRTVAKPIEFDIPCTPGGVLLERVCERIEDAPTSDRAIFKAERSNWNIARAALGSLLEFERGFVISQTTFNCVTWRVSRSLLAEKLLEVSGGRVVLSSLFSGGISDDAMFCVWNSSAIHGIERDFPLQAVSEIYLIRMSPDFSEGRFRATIPLKRSLALTKLGGKFVVTDRNSTGELVCAGGSESFDTSCILEYIKAVSGYVDEVVCRCSKLGFVVAAFVEPDNDPGRENGGRNDSGIPMNENTFYVLSFLIFLLLLLAILARFSVNRDWRDAQRRNNAIFTLAVRQALLERQLKRVGFGGFQRLKIDKVRAVPLGSDESDALAIVQFDSLSPVRESEKTQSSGSKRTNVQDSSLPNNMSAIAPRPYESWRQRHVCFSLFWDTILADDPRFTRVRRFLLLTVLIHLDLIFCFLFADFFLDETWFPLVVFFIGFLSLPAVSLFRKVLVAVPSLAVCRGTKSEAIVLKKCRKGFAGDLFLPGKKGGLEQEIVSDTSPEKSLSDELDGSVDDGRVMEHPVATLEQVRALQELEKPEKDAMLRRIRRNAEATRRLLLCVAPELRVASNNVVIFWRGDPISLERFVFENVGFMLPTSGSQILTARLSVGFVGLVVVCTWAVVLVCSRDFHRSDLWIVFAAFLATISFDLIVVHMIASVLLFDGPEPLKVIRGTPVNTLPPMNVSDFVRDIENSSKGASRSSRGSPAGFAGFQEVETPDEDLNEKESVSKPSMEGDVDGNESTVSSFAQVPQHLLEEESSTFRTTLEQIGVERKDDFQKEELNETESFGKTKKDKEQLVNLLDVELESDF